MMTTLWATALLAPLLTVLGLALVGLRPSDPAGDRARARLTWVAPWTTLPALGLALAGPAAGRVDVPELLLGTTMQVDEVARPLLLVAAVVYLAALLTTAARRTRRSPLLSAVLLTCYVGNVGSLVAADAVTFYLAFAVMSFAAYGLVVHRGTTEARRAGRVYLALTVLSEVLVLIALMFVVTAGGLHLADAPAAVAASPHTGLTVVLLLLGFAIKAGTVPFHIWVPPAHSSAPTAVSPVLSGLLVKVGVVGMLRFLPLGEAQLTGPGLGLVGVGLLGMVLAVPAGLFQHDAKVVLAYSTVSQLGLLSVLVGVALAEPAAAPACVVAAVLYSAHHGLAKATLFLGAPLWHARGVLRGWVVLGSSAAALSIAGAPLTAGFLAKYATKEAVHDQPGLALALTVVGAGTTMLLARALWLLHQHPKAPESDIAVEDSPGPLSRTARTGRRAAATAHPPHRSPAAIAGWSGLAVASAVVPWPIAALWLPDVDRPAPTAENLWDAAWPVLLGLALGTTALLLARRVPWVAQPPVLPAGDLLVPTEVATRALRARGEAASELVARGHRALRGRSGAVLSALSLAVVAERGEARLGRWRASGAALLVVTAVVLAVGWLG